MAASGITDHTLFNRSHIQRRVTAMEVKTYSEVLPYVRAGCFLGGEVSERFQLPLSESNADSFKTNSSATFSDDLSLEVCAL